MRSVTPIATPIVTSVDAVLELDRREDLEESEHADRVDV
jgi:hypothetical protein